MYVSMQAVEAALAWHNRERTSEDDRRRIKLELDAALAHLGSIYEGHLQPSEHMMLTTARVVILDLLFTMSVSAETA